MKIGHDKGFALWKTILIFLCMMGLATTTYAVSSLRITAASPVADGWLNKRQVRITASYTGVVGSATILMDGQPLPCEIERDKKELVATANDLKDGPHQIEVKAGRALGIGAVERSWKINVDTRPPSISLSSPSANAIVKDKQLKLEGRTKPGTRLTVRVSGRDHRFELPDVQTEADGSFSATVTVTDDRNKIRIDGLDRAGNRAYLVRELICDLVPPAITGIYPAPGAVIKLDPTVTIRATVDESGSGVRRAALILDGAEHEIELEPDGGPVVWKAEDLPEGTREVAIEVEDNGGWKARKEWSFLVDTTETFGMRPMTKGARGRDVAVLQKRLVRWGTLEKGRLTSVYDDETRKAVQQFQAEHKIDVDGVVGDKTVAALSPTIMVDLSSFTLTLLEAGKKVKSYGIACGMPEFPTPTGHFRVTYLERNPTWVPPKDSVWAREAKVTPPGPGNPLGTRWIGLNSNAVGIHGTPAAWSIGSRASHGCIRMCIPDVEDLYERVNPGSEVRIFWGKDPLAQN